jgi:hypothetical protein
MPGRQGRMSGTPPPRSSPPAYPFVLDGLLGTTPRRPRSVAGEGRAFGACCFAGKLRSLVIPALAALWAGRLDPLRHSYAQGWRTPPYPRVPASVQIMAPLRGSGAARPGGALRAIDSFRRSRSWRTFGPRRLRRRIQALPGHHAGWYGMAWAHIQRGRQAALVGVESRPQVRRSATAWLAALDATRGGRSHSDTWVGCTVWSTTASSSAVRVSRSICWCSRSLNTVIVCAAS